MGIALSPERVVCLQLPGWRGVNTFARTLIPTMKTKFTSRLAILLSLSATLIADSSRAEWPARVFAPYMYIGSGDNFKLTDCDDACGLKYYTLAFIIAKQDGRGKDAKYSKEPSWDGRTPMSENLYHDQIDAIRKRGGDVIMSFGGEAGKEMANVIDDADALEAAYQKVIDQYKFTWLDFDVEGNNLDKGKADSERRNTVLARLQKKNPGLIISYTLPVDPDGISDASRALLADAKAKGVKVHSANIMVMYFGKKFINKGKSEGELGVESANAAYAQLQKIDPEIQIGLCPCLGRNGSGGEVFGIEDAKTLKAFADKTPWVCSLHYWSINDDAARARRRRNAVNTTNTTGVVTSTTNNVMMPSEQKPWAFANIFESFTK
jgi:chitinase